MTAVAITGLVLGALITIGVQDLHRKLRRKLRKLTSPHVHGRIRHGRRVL